MGLAKTEKERLQLYFSALKDWMPEPPPDWRENAKPPGSAPRTSGRPTVC
jgi:hypothetical protein